jgi:malonyl-CoA O-methyltransferase
MAERLDMVMLKPARLLDLGCGSGADLQPLRARYPDTQMVPRSIDMVWSNLALHWLPDLPAALREIQRCVRVGGLFTFSMLGPDTLRELRAALDTLGMPARAHRFIDMHDVGDMLVEAGFAEPVMDMEHITLTFAGPQGLYLDLADTGSHCALAARPRGLFTPRARRRLDDALSRLSEGGRLPATMEITYGHAWRGEPRQTEDGRSIIRFERGGRP